MKNRDGKTAWPMILGLVVLVAAGSYLLGQKRINPLDWFSRPAAAEEPAAIAAKFKARCAADGAKKISCYSAGFDSLAVAGKVKLAMQSLERLKTIDPDAAPNGHVFAHGIGISAEKGGGEITTIFGQCDESNESGCYHGVLQAYFSAAKSVTAVEVNAVCAPFRIKESDRWLLFQCVHGAGHGLTMYYGHDVPRALKDCDYMPDEWGRRSCYAGVFMENIVNQQSKTAESHGLMSHEGMHMEGMAGGASEPFKALDKNDLLYPCSVMAERYLFSCYEMQTAAILYQNGGNIGSAAKTCDTAPKAMRYVCYQSLGRDISAFALNDNARAISMCNLGTDSYRPWCFFGLAKSYVNKNAKPDDGIALCKAVTEVNAKLKCYEAVGEMIGTLRAETAQRQAACDTGEAAYREACLYGARVAYQPPDALAKLNSAAAAD
ncbi:MAG: hypothetical protein V4558_03640 [Gemmatimonadota bacterium]